MIQALIQEGMDHGVIRSDIALVDDLMGKVDYWMQLFYLRHPFPSDLSRQLVDLFF